MNNIEIVFDKQTGYYDALVLSKWITTQAKSLDELIINLWEAFTLSKKKEFKLEKFNIFF